MQEYISIFDSADEDPLPASSTQLAPPVQPPPPGDSICQDKAPEPTVEASSVLFQSMLQLVQRETTRVPSDT